MQNLVTLAGIPSVNLTLARAPIYLRFTLNIKGEWDALDQLDDKPNPGEKIIAAKRPEKMNTVHVDSRGKDGRRRGDWYAYGEYSICPEQPAADVLADGEKWREWCMAQVGAPAAEETKTPDEA